MFSEQDLEPILRRFTVISSSELGPAPPRPAEVWWEKIVEKCQFHYMNTLNVIFQNRSLLMLCLKFSRSSLPRYWVQTKYRLFSSSFDTSWLAMMPMWKCSKSWKTRSWWGKALSSIHKSLMSDSSWTSHHPGDFQYKGPVRLRPSAKEDKLVIFLIGQSLFAFC